MLEKYSTTVQAGVSVEYSKVIGGAKEIFRLPV
jgi:hypothetical protein